MPTSPGVKCPWGLSSPSRSPGPCLHQARHLPSCLQPPAPPASPLTLSPRGSAPPPAALRGSQRQPSVPRLQGCWRCLAGDRRLAAGGREDCLPGKPFLYPPNPPVSAFLQGWSISPGKAWRWKMPKCPGQGELSMPGAQLGRAPGAGVQPGTQPAAWQGDNHAGCGHRSQAVGFQPPSAFGFFRQHQTPPCFTPRGCKLGPRRCRW